MNQATSTKKDPNMSKVVSIRAKKIESPPEKKPIVPTHAQIPPEVMGAVHSLSGTFRKLESAASRQFTTTIEIERIDGYLKEMAAQIEIARRGLS